MAPVNPAFSHFQSSETVDNLLEQSNKNSKLSDILTSHFLTGKKLVKDRRDG